MFDAEDEEAAGGAAGTTVPDTLASFASFASWPGGQPTSSRVGGTASGTVSGTVNGAVGGTVSGTAGGASHKHLTGSVSDAVGALLQQPGFEGGRVLVSTMQQQGGPAGSSRLASSVWQSDYGLYAQLLAPGGGPPGVTVVGPSPKTAAGAAPTVGAGSPPPAADGAGGLGGGVVRARLAALGGKPPQSGYSAGSMRECSLVALGGGGVTVQRLEAYEMASMWDPHEGL